MGRRKWKLYQDALLPKRNEAEPSSDEESMPVTDPPPALKIKTIEEINAPEDERPKKQECGTEAEKQREERRPETILESLIKRPATQPKLELPEEPADWKPPDKCYFCVDGERGSEAGCTGEGRSAGGAMSPASESDSSSVSGGKSPAGAPPILQHLLQLQHLQAQTPQAIAQQAYTEMCVQFQQMIAALAALGTGLVPPAALPPAWFLQRMVGRQQVDRIPEATDKLPTRSSSPPLTEQPLDLSAKPTSSSSGTPPPDSKLLENSRLSRTAGEGASNCLPRRTYSDDELKLALRDIQSGRLGTRRAATLYGIPRSTLRNKVNRGSLATEQGHESEPELDSEPDQAESPLILKIPTFPPPEEKSLSPTVAVTTPSTVKTPILSHTVSCGVPQPSLTPSSRLLLPPSVFVDPPSTQHLYTSLNDIIAESISQKFQQPLDRPHQSSDFPIMRAPDRHVSVIKTPPDIQRSFPSPSNSRATNNNGQPSAGGKGTRPKRGKYRNYDRDSLVEAVKAVQRGEMSVHRAGSYYGVPHSTLEYKVKERHLMRPRKREPKPQQDVKTQAPKPPPPKPLTKSFSNGLNGPEQSYPPSYPFWPGTGFAPPPGHDLYASHMIRRLREEAPPPANGSFLEGIIRSSLERPGAALLQRLTSEPRPQIPQAAETPSLLRRLAGEPALEDSPPIRRPRIDSSDRQLAAEMREAVQRLRADKLRPQSTPTPPSAVPPSLSPAPAAPTGPPDRI